MAESQEKLKAIIAQQSEEEWETTITTKEFGPKTKAEAFGHIISHTTLSCGALAVGLLTSISPCSLATHITATAYISKTISNKQKVLLSGVLYTLGRVFTYTLLGGIIYFGAGKFEVAKLFQGNGEKYIGFLMIIIGLIMLDVIKLNFIKGSGFIDKHADKFKSKGLSGSFLLGALFAMLIPLTLTASAGMALPVLFSIGTGVPVILFAIVIAFSIGKLGMYFNAVTKVEKVMRIVAGVVFILTGL